jgi:hypothetical protein
MTKTEIAVLAIKGLGRIGNNNGGQVLEIMRSLHLNTEEAVRVNREVRREATRLAYENLRFAGEYTNRYARDVRFR